MLEAIYVVGAVLLFFAQLRNGLVTATLTAVFWPITITGITLYMLVTIVYASVKK